MPSDAEPELTPDELAAMEAHERVIVAEGSRFRMTYGPYERGLTPPPLTPALADMLATIRDAHGNLDRMQQRLERARQARMQGDKL